MGNQGSTQSTKTNPNTNTNKNMKLFNDEVDKFYVTELTKTQFTTQLFAQIEQMPHPLGVNIKINRTFIVQKLFHYLSQNSRTKCVDCKQLKQFVESISKNPEKAIQKSFQMLDMDQDKSISDAEFLNFMDNCYISLMAVLDKDITDNHFKVSLKQWVSKNKKQYFDEILKIFHKHKRSDPLKWNYSDFKRWVLSGQNWTLDVNLGVKKYRMPLNLLCLFGIPKPV